MEGQKRGRDTGGPRLCLGVARASRAACWTGQTGAESLPSTPASSSEGAEGVGGLGTEPESHLPCAPLLPGQGGTCGPARLQLPCEERGARLITHCSQLPGVQVQGTLGCVCARLGECIERGSAVSGV